MSANIDIIDLGTLAYAEAFEIQQQRNQAVVDQQQPEAIFLVEHEPVITISSRASAKGHLLAPPTRLEALGIAIEQTNRGGDITYHGPGQLVAYPILRLGDHDLNLSSYMRSLEQIIIETLASFGVEGHRDPGATGVWVSQQNQSDAKICAMGVRVRKNVTMHGLALNVTTNLQHFETIVPCGLTGRAVTSLRQRLGQDCPDMATIKRRLVEVMLRHWS